MKRILSIFLVLMIVFSVSCGNNKTEQKETETTTEATTEPELVKPELKDTLKLEYDVEIDASFEISNEDYQKYNEIIDYLNAYPDKSEDVLYQELAQQYGEAVEELQDFTWENMDAAIARDNASSFVKPEIVDALATQFLNDNLKEKPDIKEIKSIVQPAGSISTVKFNNDNEAIIKFEFSDTYEKAIVFQLKINKKNIDLD